MRIILSPAKKMKEDLDTLAYMGLPEFLDQTEEILAWLRSRTQEELKRLWVCNDRKSWGRTLNVWPTWI